MNRPPMRPTDWVFLALAALLTVAWLVLLAYLVAALWGVLSG